MSDGTPTVFCSSCSSSQDRVERIEGILSGTLSYIFNNFGVERPFSSVVSEAKASGYTEPDPRDDLSGKPDLFDS